MEAGREARRLRQKQRARARRRKALAFVALAAVAALLVGLSAGGFLGNRGHPARAGKNPKRGYAAVLRPDAGSAGIEAPASFAPTLVNVAYRSIAPQLPGITRESFRDAHQSVLDPSWASVRVGLPEREGYYAVFLKCEGGSWRAERSVLIDENTYPKDPDADLRDVPRDLSKTLEFPEQDTGSARKPADLAVKLIDQMTDEKDGWTAGETHSSGRDYVVEVRNKKDKSRKTDVYLTGDDGLYSVVAIGKDLTSTEAPGFPRKLVEQEEPAGREKARIEPAAPVIHGSIDRSSIRSGLEGARKVVDDYPGVAGFYVDDLKSGSGYGVRPDEEFFSASVIKVPVMIAVFRRIDQGKLSYKDVFKTTKDDMATGAGGLQWEPVGTSQTVEDYLWLMITHSDNVATNVLTRAVGGRRYVNQVAHSLGARDTLLYQKLSSERAAVPSLDNRTTPKDMATLLAKIYENKAASKHNCHEMIDLLKQNNLEFWMEAGVPPDVKVANKGGWLDSTYNDAGIVEYKKRPYVLAVFSKYGPNDLQGGGNMIALISKNIWRAESGGTIDKNVKKRARVKK